MYDHPMYNADALFVMINSIPVKSQHFNVTTVFVRVVGMNIVEEKKEKKKEKKLIVPCVDVPL